MKMTTITLLRLCLSAPWRLTASSYACLVLTLMLSAAAHEGYYEPYLIQLGWNLAYSASCLLGLTLLVAAALSAFAALCRPRGRAPFDGLVNAVVLLLTLPPLALHLYSFLQPYLD